MANCLDTVFAALSDPTRRAVIEDLGQGAQPVTALHARHDMALPTFLRHVRVLEDSGLVTSQKKGRVRMVSLSPDPMQQAEAWINTHRKNWNARLDRLEDLAKRMERTTS